jgi:hypothetical protein
MIVTTGSLNCPTTPTTPTNATLRLQGNSWSGAVFEVLLFHQWGLASATENTGSDGTSNDASGSWTSVEFVQADRTYRARAAATETYAGPAEGAVKLRKTFAMLATASSPTSGSITATTASIACNYYPNTYESACSAQLQYKRTVDPTWINAGTPNAATGYGQATVGAALTGLSGSAQYDVRLVITRGTENDQSLTSATATFTTAAAEPVVITGDASAVAHTDAVLNGYLTHNGFDGNAFFVYGLTNPPTAGVYYQTPNQSMTASGAFAVAITGLTAATTYYFQTVYQYPQNTFGGLSAFTTTAPPPVPEVFTGTASSVEHSSAVLNGTVSPNGVATIVAFQWGPDSTYGYTTATQGPTSVTYPVAFAAALSGLVAGFTYYFRAIAFYDGVTYFGTDQTFVTGQAPEAYAAQEDHVTVFEFNERKYGVDANGVGQEAFFIALASPAATSSNRLFSGSQASFAAGDVQVSKDGGAWANIGTLPAGVNGGTDTVFKVVLTAAEMQANLIVVRIIDQTADPAFRDCLLVIRTRQMLQTLDIAGNLAIGGNLAATGNISAGGDLTVGDDVIIGDAITAASMTLSGNLTAAAFAGILSSMVLRTGLCQAGATPPAVRLDSGASASNDYYNGCIWEAVAGTGAGQSRIITDYDGTNKDATLDGSLVTGVDATTRFIIRGGPRVWDVPPTSAELASIPGATAAAGLKLQALFQRFTFKIDQTATVQTWYKTTGAVLGTRSVSDNGTTQTIAKIT